jgi:hypothetical protein
MKTESDVCWVLTPCSVVLGTNVSEVHAASVTLKKEEVWSFETLVFYHITTVS